MLDELNAVFSYYYSTNKDTKYIEAAPGIRKFILPKARELDYSFIRDSFILDEIYRPFGIIEVELNRWFVVNGKKYVAGYNLELNVIVFREETFEDNKKVA